ncbi:DUF4097 domain-containing protein [Robertmurraya yapensis]|uniref:DUF4097 domain-containing protein n=1 Tax=Bacillus yapensis TaxID=2492960 RepID=A0A3S0KWU9_9BACI|nr:DUF4097 domain-containing protein [Bacillus yapensis]RTR36148.1 DUF4097 domain-containing protein [Bacillus yapensis]TKT05651.1 DUF4097 domain-containing protein [Bacillus yapensis]
MKRILLIFLIIAGGYILFTTIGNLTWFANKDQMKAEISDKIDNIEFDIASANVTIIPENRDDLEAQLTGKGKVTVKQKGDTITVEYKQKWFSWFNFFNHSKLNVYVPEDYKEDMVIDIGSGNLELSGESAKQPFKLNHLILDMSSGNVELNDLVVNEFAFDGSSGNVEIHSLDSKTTSVDVSSGNVKISDFAGELEADISSGRFDAQFAELRDSISIDVSSGNVTLDLPDKADFTLEGETGSGNISSNFPLKVENQDKHEIKGTHGSGKHEIEIDVSSGNVEIN